MKFGMDINVFVTTDSTKSMEGVEIVLNGVTGMECSVNQNSKHRSGVEISHIQDGIMKNVNA